LLELEWRPGAERGYKLTEKGEVFIQALQRVPLSVLKWEVPCGVVAGT